MITLTAPAGGNISEDYPVIPGQAYSLYFAGKAGGGHVPTAGMLRAYHHGEELDFPILDNTGLAVSADLSAVNGLAVSFTAHTNVCRITAAGLTENDELVLSLIPIRS